MARPLKSSHQFSSHQFELRIRRPLGALGAVPDGGGGVDSPEIGQVMPLIPDRVVEHGARPPAMFCVACCE